MSRTLLRTVETRGARTSMGVESMAVALIVALCGTIRSGLQGTMTVMGISDVELRFYLAYRVGLVIGLKRMRVPIGTSLHIACAAIWRRYLVGSFISSRRGRQSSVRLKPPQHAKQLHKQRNNVHQDQPYHYPVKLRSMCHDLLLRHQL